MSQKVLRFFGVASIFVFVVASLSMAAVTPLPDPTGSFPDQAGNLWPISSQHDDFFSYSADLLTQLGYEGFDGSVGTGGLDFLIYTGAVGQSNASVAGGPFPDPLNAPTGVGEDTFSGTYSPVAVDSVLKFLHSFDSNVNIPVFNFDMNQTGSNPTILMNGQVRIWDPVTKSVVAFWAFDNVENDAFDADSMVTAFGKMDVGVCFDKKNNPVACYELDNNKGSGQLDFIAFAPTMDLSLYGGKGYQFLADFNLAGANNGHEELFMTGAFAPSNVVPEPASMLLLGTGLLGLFGIRKREK